MPAAIVLLSGVLALAAPAQEAQAPAAGSTALPDQAPAAGSTALPDQAPAAGSTALPDQAPAAGSTALPDEAPAPAAETQPRIQVNFLNPCRPAPADVVEMGRALASIKTTPRFSSDFEISRGVTTLTEAEARAAGVPEET